MNDQTKLETITVYTPGTHAGKRYTPGPDGHELQVTAQDAELLRARKAHVRPEAAPQTVTAPQGSAPAASQTSHAVAELPAGKVAVATRPQG